MSIMSQTEADVKTASDQVADTGAEDEAKAKIVSWAKSNFYAAKADRANVERTWYMNMCFYRGKQNVAYRQQVSMVTGVGGQLYIPPAPYWRSRPVINRIKPIIRSELARLTSQKPTANVVPATSDDRDMFAAQAGEQIWDSIFRDKKVAAVVRRALWWNQVCGNAYIKNGWDPDAVADGVGKNGESLQGDICFDAITPFHLFVPDIREPDLEKQSFVIHAMLQTQEWVKLNHPEAKYNTGDRQNEVLDDSWLDILGAQVSRNRKSVLCLECWIKPGKFKQFPSGGVYTIIGDTLVQSTKGWPYDHGKYPFAKLEHIPSGKFYTDSTIVDLVPLQREYNRTNGQIIESKNAMAKPQIIAEKGAIDPSKITSEPGQVIEYQPGYNKPEQMRLEPIPSYVPQQLDRIIQDMNDISGQHEVSKGQVPPGVTAATAINFLQEQDDSMLSFSFASLEEAYEKLGFMTLSYVQQYWDAPRIVKVVGEDGYFDSLSFKGSDLRSNTDIRIEAGSALPTSKAAKQAFIMDLMKMGFIDPATGLEVMEMGGISKIYEAVQVDVRQAQRENLKMAQFAKNPEMAQMAPQLVPVNSYDNHMLHISTHNKYRKGQAFEMLDDVSKEIFEQHVQMHVAASMGGQTGTNSIEMMKDGANVPSDPFQGQAPPSAPDQAPTQFGPTTQSKIQRGGEA